MPSRQIGSDSGTSAADPDVTWTVSAPESIHSLLNRSGFTNEVTLEEVVEKTYGSTTADDHVAAGQTLEHQ